MKYIRVDVSCSSDGQIQLVTAQRFMRHLNLNLWPCGPTMRSQNGLALMRGELKPIQLWQHQRQIVAIHLHLAWQWIIINGRGVFKGCLQTNEMAFRLTHF